VRAIAAALVTRAKSGDVVAAREVLDRTLGKASQKIDMDLRAETASAGSVPTDDERIAAALELDVLHCLPVRLLECGLNAGTIKPKEARRAERIKAFIESTRREMDAEPDNR
jgi:hypothetical protein